MWWLVILLISDCSSKTTNRKYSESERQSLSFNHKDANASNKGEVKIIGTGIHIVKSNVTSYDPPRWIVVTVSVPVVMIFVLFVAIIAYKTNFNDHTTDIDRVKGNASQPNESLKSPDFLEKNKTKKNAEQNHKKKNKASEDIYNTMMEQFKAGKTRKMSYTGARKSSQIQLEGFNGNCPKDIARKHLLLGRLNETIDIDDGPEIAVNKLVETSSRTLVGNIMFRHLIPEDSVDKDASIHIKALIERSKEDLSSCIDLLPDDVKNLLPEDLEDAFVNFASWQESLL